MPSTRLSPSEASPLSPGPFSSGQGRITTVGLQKGGLPWAPHSPQTSESELPVQACSHWRAGMRGGCWTTCPCSPTPSPAAFPHLPLRPQSWPWGPHWRAPSLRPPGWVYPIGSKAADPEGGRNGVLIAPFSLCPISEAVCVPVRKAAAPAVRPCLWLQPRPLPTSAEIASHCY